LDDAKITTSKTQHNAVKAYVKSMSEQQGKLRHPIYTCVLQIAVRCWKTWMVYQTKRSKLFDNSVQKNRCKMASLNTTIIREPILYEI